MLQDKTHTLYIESFKKQKQMYAQTEILSACTHLFCLSFFSSISLPTLVLHKQKLYPSPTHSPTHNHTALLGQVVRWCFELLMKLAPVPGRRGGVCFQKPKLPLTWGQSFCPSESRSNLLTLASVSAGVLLKFKDTNCSKECQYAVFSNI